ncbi:MAG: hypothetical protein ABR511_00455, partial [Acidimicrobiales bacterium]
GRSNSWAASSEQWHGRLEDKVLAVRPPLDPHRPSPTRAQSGEELLLLEPVNMAFCRFLLMHVAEPLVVLRRMGQAVRPLGWVVGARTHHLGRAGRPPAFWMPGARHPDVGAQLPVLVGDAGLEVVDAWVESQAGAGPGPVAD